MPSSVFNSPEQDERRRLNYQEMDSSRNQDQIEPTCHVFHCLQLTFRNLYHYLGLFFSYVRQNFLLCVFTSANFLFSRVVYPFCCFPPRVPVRPVLRQLYRQLLLPVSIFNGENFLERYFPNSRELRHCFDRLV